MKTNATVRIILYALLILILISILVAGLAFDLYTFNTGSSAAVEGTEGCIAARDVSKLSIEWAAGSVTIVTADTDQITFSESGNFAEKYTMVYSRKGDTLTIAYSNSSVTVGFGSIPSKDLTITVPHDWVCEELELDGAALEVEINGLTVREFDIDGASNEISFTGSLEILECDGAACELTLKCQTKPRSIDLDGASVQMDLYLPNECGFIVQMDGLSCSFDSDLEYTGNKGSYSYSDRYCQIDVDGLSCDIKVNQAPVAVEAE